MFFETNLCKREAKALKENRDLNNSIYSDASYRQSCGNHPYGYSPNRGYHGPESSSQRKTHMGAASLICLCLICVLLAGVLGMGGTILIFRHQTNSLTAETAAAEELYDVLTAEAVSYDQEDTVSFLSLSSSEGMETLSPEDIYTVTCESTVGITLPGQSTNIFGQSGSGSVSGSGLILSENGYILTNYHVIEKAYENDSIIRVLTFDGTQYTADVIGVETDSDLAVLKIAATGLTPAVLGNSEEMRVGQTVYVVGNPLGELTYTMTSGIVSALDRNITTDINVTVNMFQIDAAVNNGNSGGPVCNAYGQVIGIVTAKYSENGMEGLGFAIPISDVYTVANELIANGYVSGKAYLGLTLTTVSASVAKYYNMVEGVYIYSVEPGSCAQKAGLKTGDIITAIDGQELLDKNDLIAAMKNYYAGESAAFTVYRDQAYTIITVVFDEELPIGIRASREMAETASQEMASTSEETAEEAVSSASGEPASTEANPADAASGEASGEP